MQFLDILAYVAALVPFTISPGPLIAIVIARCVAGDSRGAAGFSAGMIIGYVSLMGFVCLGLGAWLQSIPGVLETIKYFALVYFLWIAMGIWRGGGANKKDVDYASGNVASSVFAGITTSMASPHVILFFILLTPRLMNMENVTISQFTLAALVTMVSLMIALGLVIYIFQKFGTLFGNSKGGGIVTKAMAVMIGLAGVWMVAG